MTIPATYDLPAGYDNWKQSQPDSQLVSERNQQFTIEFGDDQNTFTKETYKTLSSAMQEAKRLFMRFGYAILTDEFGNEMGRW